VDTVKDRPLIVYHHDDLDGHASAAVVWYFNKDRNITYYEVNHTDEIKPPKNCDVYLVDMVFPRDIMLELRQNNDFVWIDHHQTAIDNLSDEHFTGIQRVGQAGCVLTWENFNVISQRRGNPPLDLPYFIQIFGDFDVWNNKNEYYWNDTVLPVKYAMEMQETLPSNPDNIWRSLFNEDELHSMYLGVIMNCILEKGRIIQQYVTKTDATFAKNNAFVGKFEGWRALILNNGARNGSNAFNAVFDSEKHDIMIAYVQVADGIKYSLYTPKTEYIHVGELATKYGGGGHAGAGGFYIKDTVLPFEF